MKFKFCFLIFIVLLYPELSLAQQVEELFNEKDLSGWYAFDKESGKHSNATDIFSVDRQMIRMSGKNVGYLMSEKSYSTFELMVEFRWNLDSTFVRRSDKKNSGVMYLVPRHTPDVLWPKGIQFQIKEGFTGDFILLQETTLWVNGEKIAPGKSVAVQRFSDAEKPAGEWNRIKISFDGEIIKQELNGVLVNEGTKPSVNEGRILLQYEGFPIDFRKVELTNLKH